MNKEQKTIQKVARRKKLAAQHIKTNKELKRRVTKSPVDRLRDIALRRLKKTEDK